MVIRQHVQFGTAIALMLSSQMMFSQSLQANPSMQSPRPVQATGQTSTQAVVTPLFRGITYTRKTLTAPRPLNLHLVSIDLSDPAIRFQVTADNGALPGDTTAETTPAFLQRIRAQVGINANFFAGERADFPYIRTQGKLFTRIISLAAARGQVYSQPVPAFPGLGISRTNQVSWLSGQLSPPTTFPAAQFYNAVSGNIQLVKAGRSVVTAADDQSLAPRTAIATTADRRLLLLVVDGRRSGVSEGMNYAELADTLIQLGATEAMNLDGGSSSTLAVCPKSFTCSVMNQPSNGFPVPVGNNLAVFAAPYRR